MLRAFLKRCAESSKCQKITLFVELLDEGTDSWRAAEAIDLGQGLFRLVKPQDYDPEEEFWAFLPGDVVRLRNAELPDGTKGLLATHPDSSAVRVMVRCFEAHAPEVRETFALPEGGGIFRILKTPHYSTKQQWEFPPGSLVRLQKNKGPYPGFDYFVATAI